ncbi:MAG TPA: MFS transporter [Streptosporangiaceae bacterium]|jgi:predicted MFS family arabinose efflux permease
MALPDLLRVRPARLMIVNNPSFGLLWSGQLLSSIGSWLLVVAVPVAVFRLTGSARDTGLATVAEVLPVVALGPVAGVFADRWNRRTVMVTASLAQAAAVLLLIFFTSADRLWLLLLAVVAENGIGMFFTPAYQGVVPFTVGRGSDLDNANGWSAAARGITGLSGGPLGGAVYAALGFRAAVGLDAASYVVAAGCIAAMPVLRAARGEPTSQQAIGPSRQGPQPSGPREAARRLAMDLRTGVATLAANRTLSVLLAVTTAFLLGNGGATALLVPFVTTRLDGDASTLGVLMCALGGGYLAGAYTGRRACSSARLRRWASGMVGGVAATFAVLFNTHSLAVAVAAISLAGLAGGTFLMLRQTLLQRLAPDAMIGRISAVYATAASAATLAGALLATVTVHSLGLTRALDSSVAVIAAGAVVALMLPARIAGTEEPPPVRE